MISETIKKFEDLSRKIALLISYYFIKNLTGIALTQRFEKRKACESKYRKTDSKHDKKLPEYIVFFLMR